MTLWLAVSPVASPSVQPVAATDWPGLAVEVFKAALWPATVLIIFFVLRGPIAGLIPALEQLRYKDLELKFRQGLIKAEEEAAKAQLPPPPAEPPAFVPQPPDQLPRVLPDYLFPMAWTSPTAAVLEAWARIENEMRRRLKSVRSAQPRTVREVTRELVKARVIPSEAEELINDLRALRNDVAHARLNLDPVDAVRYLELATRLVAVIGRDSDDKADG